MNKVIINKIKDNILALYNVFITIFIALASLSSIFIFEWWKGILLFLNFLIFSFIAYLNIQLYEKIKKEDEIYE